MTTREKLMREAQMKEVGAEAFRRRLDRWIRLELKTTWVEVSEYETFFGKIIVRKVPLRRK